ncbi:MAG: efflux RND transporter periplasmic adaptor subunit [Rhodoferax sp.]
MYISSPMRGVAAAGLLLVLAACSKPAAQPEPIRSVKVIQIQTSALQTGAEYAGEVRARTESRLGFRVAGKLVSRPVQVGQRVRAGQVLAQLDAQDLQLAAQAAQAQLSAAQTSRDLAAADLKRFKELRAQNFISGAELERREANYNAAQAQWEQAQAQAKAQGNQAAYTRLAADAAGVVTAVDAEPGQVLAAGSPVLRLALDGARDVVFNVPEDRVAAFAVGAKAQVRPWAGGDLLDASVREVAASADPVTRTFAIKLALQGSESLPLGATVTVLPQLAANAQATAAVLRLPTSTLYRKGQETVVWLLDTASMTVKAQKVDVERVDDNSVVLRSGVQAGQWVVAAGVHVLSDGQKVVVFKEKSAPAPVNTADSATKTVADAVLPPQAPSSALAAQ